jgi:hypothetical protein
MTTANAWKNTERRLQQPPTPLKDIPTRAFAKAQKTLNAGLVPPCWLMLVSRRLVTITPSICSATASATPSTRAWAAQCEALCVIPPCEKGF